MKNKFFKNWINEKDKTLNWKNTNLFFVGTAAIIVLVLLISKIFESKIGEITATNNFWNCFLTSFNPNYSMIMFAACSVYLERKYGSIKLFCLVVIVIPISNIIGFAFDFLDGDTLGWSGRGFSCVAFFVCGIFIVNLIFDFKTIFTNKFAFVFPLIVLVICVLFMCINLPDAAHTHVYFDCFGRLTENPGHYGPFAIGIVSRSVFQLFKEKKQ